MSELVAVLLALAGVALIGLLLVRVGACTRELRELSSRLSTVLEAKHREMLVDLHSGLTQQGDRVGAHVAQSTDRLRAHVGEELTSTRDSLHQLKLAISESMHVPPN